MDFQWGGPDIKNQGNIDTVVTNPERMNEFSCTLISHHTFSEMKNGIFSDAKHNRNSYNKK